MQTATATTSSAARTTTRPAAAIAPRVATCEPKRRAKLLAAYQMAFGWARGAVAWLQRWLRSPRLRRASWSSAVRSACAQRDHGASVTGPLFIRSTLATRPPPATSRSPPRASP